MKYLKLFEKQKKTSDLVDSKKYWLLPTDRRFRSALKKIGFDRDIHSFVTSLRKRLLDKPDYNNYVFICYESFDEDCPFSWMPYQGELFDEYLENEEFKFSGLINIEEYELSLKKYNL